MYALLAEPSIPDSLQYRALGIVNNSGKVQTEYLMTWEVMNQPK